MEMYGQGRYTIALKKERKEMYSLTLTLIILYIFISQVKIGSTFNFFLEKLKSFSTFYFVLSFYSLNSSDVYLNIKKVFQYLL